MISNETKLVAAMLGLFTIVGIAACGGSDEKSSTTGTGGTTGTASGGSGMAATGGAGMAATGGTTGAADLSGFIGGWQYVAGTSNLNCATIDVNETSQLTGDKYTIAKGVDAPLVYSETDSKCVWKYSSAGSVMTLLPNQTCMDKLNDQDLGLIDVTITPIASTVTVTGTTATVAFSANYALNIRGSIVNCSMSASGNVSKISN